MDGPKDAFKYATEPSWQVAWKDRIEPDLQDYVGFSSNMIKFPKEDSNIALYDNFYSARYLELYIKLAGFDLNCKSFFIVKIRLIFSSININLGQHFVIDIFRYLQFLMNSSLEKLYLHFRCPIFDGSALCLFTKCNDLFFFC